MNYAKDYFFEVFKNSFSETNTLSTRANVNWPRAANKPASNELNGKVPTNDP
jgi:hypothetical protein